MIWHLVYNYRETNHLERARLNRAKATWKNSGMKLLELTSLPRKLDGEHRDVPFVHDMIAETPWSPGDAIAITNMDASLVRDSGKILADLGIEACFSHRRNFDKPIRTQLNQGLRGDYFQGVDLVYFTYEWWQANGKNYPDMVMGCEAWDWIFRFMIWIAVWPEIVYHENHGIPYWQRNQLISPSNLWNRKLAYEWYTTRDRSKWLDAYIIWRWFRLEDYCDDPPCLTRPIPNDAFTRNGRLGIKETERTKRNPWENYQSDSL